MIKEMKANTEYKGFLLVRKMDEKKTKKGETYLDMTLSDKTGDIEAKKWNASLAQFQKVKIMPGTLCYVIGSIAAYNDQLQMVIENIRIATDKDGQKIEDYIKTAPMTQKEMMDVIRNYAGKISNVDIKQILVKIVAEYKEALSYYPAAMKNHHAMHGGLLYHTVRMLKLAEASTQIYPDLNQDLLYAGIILHDIEKINEMIADQQGVVSDYSKEGKLLGHLTMGVIKIAQVGESVGASKEAILNLQHIVLSHHGQRDWGSPILPATQEAICIHHLDNLDAKMQMCEEITVDKGQFSEKSYALQTQLYKPEL